LQSLRALDTENTDDASGFVHHSDFLIALCVPCSPWRGGRACTRKSSHCGFLQSLGFLDTWAAKERGFYRKYGLDAEIIADARPLAEPVKTVLDHQGKPDLPLNRVVDPTIVEEVLRERR